MIAVVTAVSRLPFLGAGYGTDPDGCRVAGAAKTLITTGEYVYSRAPGYPVQEFVSALLFRGGPWLVNGATALLSVVAVVFFVLSLRRMQIENANLAGLMLAFTPVIYVNSTVTLDYVWALGFIMASMYLLLQRRLAWSGLVMGLAIGCRVTSGAMLLPFGVMIGLSWRGIKPREAALDLLRFVVPALLVGGLLYLPVYLKYGSGFFTFYDGTWPGLEHTLRRMSFDVWGRAGSYGLLLIVLAAIALPRVFRKKREPDAQRWRFVLPSLLVIALYLIAFLRLPSDAGYLIPLLPFVILLLAGWLRRYVMVLLCLLLAVTCFIDLQGPRVAFGVPAGAVLSQHRYRDRDYRYVQRLSAKIESLPDSSVVVVAWMQPYIRLLRTDTTHNDIRIAYYADDSLVNRWTEEGRKIYHLPSIAIFNEQEHGLDLSRVSTILDVR